MKKTILTLSATMLCAVVYALHAPARAEPPASYGLADPDPLGKEGYYTSSILKFLDVWPPATLAISDQDRTILTQAIRTPDHPKIIGLIKHFNVQAPLERVAEATERFEDYPKIWEGIISVQVESHERNRFVTRWLRKPPAFILPQLHYRLLYISDRRQPNRVVYRQQLIDGNALNSSDGVIVLEKRGENLTRVSIVNFFDPDAGPFRSFVESVIWEKTVQHSVKDDTAFRAHIEHPDWSEDRLEEESDHAWHAWEETHADPVPYTDQLTAQLSPSSPAK